jgi:hypothetical protein
MILGSGIERNKGDVEAIQGVKTTVKVLHLLSKQIHSVRSKMKSILPSILSSEDEQQSLQQTLKSSKLRLQQRCQSLMGSAPLDDDPIITQFRPEGYQSELNNHNITHRCVRATLRNYCRYINTTPLPIFRYFIETKRCDVNAQDDEGNTAIHIALRSFNPNKGGDINILMYLLLCEGIDVNKGR